MLSLLNDPLFLFLRCTEIIYGLFWLFSALNAHFQWKKIPFVSHEMDDFTSACYKAKFVMPTVKILELIVGTLFLLSFTSLALILILPIVYGIVGLHLFFNKKNGAMIISILAPFLILLFFKFKFKEFLVLIN